MQVKLTENRISALPFKGKAYPVRDAAVTGFFVDVNKTSKSYKLQADLWTGTRGERTRVRVIRHTLGRHGEIPLDVARARAAALLAQIKAGVDPFEAKPKEAGPSVWSVEEAFSEYAEDLRKHGAADRTVTDLASHLGYLESWKTLPITGVTKAMARERHVALTLNHGAVTANKVMRSFRAVFNLAQKKLDAPLGLNPVIAVTFNEEKPRDRCIDDLAQWYGRVQKLPNALRRLMHEFALFSGLRPGNLVALEKAWVRLDERAIVIPADCMKGRREFALPLSAHLTGLVQRILDLSEIVEPGSPYLFPTRNTAGKVVHVQVWGEKLLGKATGHTIRHTYSNCARLAGVDDIDRELLLAHKIPGVQGVYLHVPTLFSRLLAAQERVSTYLEGKVAQ